MKLCPVCKKYKSRKDLNGICEMCAFQVIRNFDLPAENYMEVYKAVAWAIKRHHIFEKRRTKKMNNNIVPLM
jgi:hypothetical protein